MVDDLFWGIAVLKHELVSTLPRLNVLLFGPIPKVFGFLKSLTAIDAWAHRGKFKINELNEKREI